MVGQLPEFREKDDKNGKADAELSITLPAVVNGRLIPGDVDRLQFPLPPAGAVHARATSIAIVSRPARGRISSCVVSARDLMPYLADAVPGWFQATLTLYDASGHEVAYDDDYRFQPDPVLHYKIPADGDYVARDQGRALPRPRGLRLPHRHRRAARSSPASSRSAGRPDRRPPSR